MKLTERKIETEAVRRDQKDRLIFDDAQRGLAVRITASGSRSYLCQYSLHGQKWRVPLGACSALSLASAREAAAAIGKIGSHVLEWSVCREIALEQVGYTLGWGSRPQAYAAAAERMKNALDELCKLWGIG